MKIKTLNDLKNFLNGLNEEQLSQESILYIVDRGSENIAGATISEEDEYFTDEGYEPVSTFEPFDEEDKLEDYHIRPKGFVYLYNE